MNKNNDQELYAMLAEICAAMGHPVRIMIVDQLTIKESNCTDLLKVLNIPKANLSQHLSVLKKAGLVKVRREGLFLYHSLAMPEMGNACAMIKEVLAKRSGQDARSALELQKKLKK